MKKKIIIGSRESRLAVVQSETVLTYIKENCPELEAELLLMKTTGDKILDRTLDKVGGKGLFVKELDKALRDGRSDVSVHSLKDVPMEVPEDLPLLAFSPRADVRDVLVLPEGVTEIDFSKPLGCSSMRRVLQLRKVFPQAQFKPVRGNVQTRLAKLEAGEYTGLILAAAGLKRLGLESRINRYFTTDEVIPAAGQAIMAVQGRGGEDYSWLEGYDCREARYAALAERALVRKLNGGCSSPIAGYAEIDGEKMVLRGLYCRKNDTDYVTGEIVGNVDEAEELGERLAEELKQRLVEFSDKDAILREK